MKFIRAARAAKIFGVHSDTIRNWDRRGKLKPDFRSPTGQRFYSEARLLEILKAGRIPDQEEKDDDQRPAA